MILEILSEVVLNKEIAKQMKANWVINQCEKKLQAHP